VPKGTHDDSPRRRIRLEKEESSPGAVPSELQCFSPELGDDAQVGGAASDPMGAKLRQPPSGLTGPGINLHPPPQAPYLFGMN
jgi:hypothetical protein